MGEGAVGSVYMGMKFKHQCLSVGEPLIARCGGVKGGHTGNAL